MVGVRMGEGVEGGCGYFFLAAGADLELPEAEGRGGGAELQGRSGKHHTPHVTRHTSHVTRHTSHVTRHKPHTLTCRFS